MISPLKAVHDKTVALLWALNISDLCFTLVFIASNWATEANPILHFFFTKSVYLFAAVKISVSTIGALILKKFADNDTAVVGAAFACGIYAAVFAYQAYMAITGALWTAM